MSAIVGHVKGRPFKGKDGKYLNYFIKLLRTKKLLFVLTQRELARKGRVLMRHIAKIYAEKKCLN